MLGTVDAFLGVWAAHGHPLRSARELRESRFLIIAVDEAAAGASGCSIDALVREIRGLEAQLGVTLVDHGPIVFRDGGTIRRVPRDEFADAGAGRPRHPGHARLRQHHLAAGRPPGRRLGAAGVGLVARPRLLLNRKPPRSHHERDETRVAGHRARGDGGRLGAGRTRAVGSRQGGAGSGPRAGQAGRTALHRARSAEDARRHARRHQGRRLRRGRDAAADPGRPAAAAEEARARPRRADTSTPRSCSTSARLRARRPAGRLHLREGGRAGEGGRHEVLRRRLPDGARTASRSTTTSGTPTR